MNTDVITRLTHLVDRIDTVTREAEEADPFIDEVHDLLGGAFHEDDIAMRWRPPEVIAEEHADRILEFSDAGWCCDMACPQCCLDMWDFPRLTEGLDHHSWDLTPQPPYVNFVPERAIPMWLVELSYDKRHVLLVVHRGAPFVHSNTRKTLFHAAQILTHPIHDLWECEVNSDESEGSGA